MTAMLRLTVLLFLGFTLFAADGVRAQPTPIDLGTLGGSFSFPSGLNNRGQVVGTSTTVGDNLSTGHAFLWTETTGMVDLGTLGGATSVAADVNNRGSGGRFEPGSRTIHSRLPVDQARWDGRPPGTVNRGIRQFRRVNKRPPAGHWQLRLIPVEQSRFFVDSARRDCRPWHARRPESCSVCPQQQPTKS